jgi:hypothetical protein
MSGESLVRCGKSETTSHAACSIETLLLSIGIGRNQPQMASVASGRALLFGGGGATFTLLYCFVFQRRFALCLRALNKFC